MENAAFFEAKKNTGRPKVEKLSSLIESGFFIKIALVALSDLCELDILSLQLALKVLSLSSLALT
jgi:hypothetical protein